MRIGIIRHFKVKHKLKSKWINSKQFKECTEAYNNSEIISPNDINYDDNWDICFSSDLKRAEVTAKLIYSGIIIRTKDLRKIEIKKFKIAEVILHYNIWLIISRIVWYFSQKSQDEKKYETISRAKKFIDLIETSNYSKILVVSHGSFMKYLNKELK